MTHQRPADSRTVHVEGLARVEGEGSLLVEVRDGTVETVELEIFEPPRFFEAFLQGRRHTEAPDITARICGSARCLPDEALASRWKTPAEWRSPTRSRRSVACCTGEWIQSHALHIHFLHAPDFFGCEDAVELAGLDLPPCSEASKSRRSATTFGGHRRSRIHPVNVRVGGFYRAPSREELAALVEPLRRARDAALVSVGWVAGFEFPDIEIEYRFVSLRHPDYYAIESGGS